MDNIRTNGGFGHRLKSLWAVMRVRTAVSLIEKVTDEHRTSDVCRFRQAQPLLAKKRPVLSDKKFQQDKCLRSIDECRIKECLLFYSLKKQSEASPPACKPVKPTGWKRARRDYSTYASESDIHHSSIFNLHSSFQVASYKLVRGDILPVFIDCRGSSIHLRPNLWWPVRLR